jgi:hypothetical protein
VVLTLHSWPPQVQGGGPEGPYPGEEQQEQEEQDDEGEGDGDGGHRRRPAAVPPQDHLRRGVAVAVAVVVVVVVVGGGDLETEPIIEEMTVSKQDLLHSCENGLLVGDRGGEGGGAPGGGGQGRGGGGRHPPDRLPAWAGHLLPQHAAEGGAAPLAAAVRALLVPRAKIVCH